MVNTFLILYNNEIMSPKGLWSSVYGRYNVLLEALCWLAWSMFLCMVSSPVVVGNWLRLIHS
jgi:hypothetical protein